jgi:hypothetical protein
VFSQLITVSSESRAGIPSSPGSLTLFSPGVVHKVNGANPVFPGEKHRILGKIGRHPIIQNPFW